MIKHIVKSMALIGSLKIKGHWTRKIVLFCVRFKKWLKDNKNWACEDTIKYLIFITQNIMRQIFVSNTKY